MRHNATVNIYLDWYGQINIATPDIFTIELEGMGPNGENEVYKIKMPNITVHNIFWGQNMYLDIGGESTITNITRPGLSCTLNYQSRGWTEASYFVVKGVVKLNKESLYNIEGKWNNSIWVKSLNPKDKETPADLVFSKHPTKENSE